MIPAAAGWTDLFLSLAAVAGLAVLHAAISARGPDDPLNRRFLTGLRVTLLLFGARALESLTGAGVFHLLVLVAAALIPIAVLILTEGLLRRHAPPWIKAGVGVGTVVFVLAAAVPAAVADPLRLYALLGFQVGGLLAAGWMVISRDRAGLSGPENRAVERLGLSLILLIPLGAADFLMADIGLPVRISALAVLFLCWLAMSLGREELQHGSALTGFVAVLLAAGLATALLAVIAALDADGVILTGAIITAALLVAVIVNDARALRGEAESLTLLRHLAEGEGDALGFLRGLQAHPLVQGAVVIDAAALADLDAGVLARIFAADPVLRAAEVRAAAVQAAVVRAEAVRAEGTEDADHVAHLFDRFAATHILCVGAAPLTLVALSMPAIVASPRMELELRAVQRMAWLLARQGDRGAA